jgi:hypothetical protein
MGVHRRRHGDREQDRRQQYPTNLHALPLT